MVKSMMPVGEVVLPDEDNRDGYKVPQPSIITDIIVYFGFSSVHDVTSNAG